MSWQPSGWTPGGWSPSWQPSTPPQEGGGGFNLPPIGFEPPPPEPSPYVPDPSYIDPHHTAPLRAPTLGAPSPGVFARRPEGAASTFSNIRRGFSDRFGGTRGRVGSLLGSAIAGPVGGLLGSFVANLLGRRGQEIEMPMSSSDYFERLYGSEPPASSFHSQRSGTRFVQGEADPADYTFMGAPGSHLPQVFAGERRSLMGNVTTTDER